MLSINDKLKMNLGIAVQLVFDSGNIKEAGIAEIDPANDTVKYINKKGLDELRLLPKGENFSFEEQTKIIHNPENFTVINISHIADVIYYEGDKSVEQRFLSWQRKQQ
jgi:hypothetical protein